MTPQPPAVTYYKISPGPASLPAGSLMRQQHANQMHMQQQQQQQQQYCQSQYAAIPQQMYYTGNGFVYPPQCGYLGPMVLGGVGGGGSHVGVPGQGGPHMKQQEFSDMR